MVGRDAEIAALSALLTDPSTPGVLLTGVPGAGKTRLAAEAAGPVLELGSGTGRVALEVAGHGHEVVAGMDAAGRTSGGRVVHVSATGATLVEAHARAYAAAGRISWPGIHYRNDIGAQALEGATP